MKKRIDLDNPPEWVKQLRDKFEGGLCGCYEGDIGRAWDASVQLESEADYIDDYGSHKYYMKMGWGQKELIDFIKSLLEK